MVRIRIRIKQPDPDPYKIGKKDPEPDPCQSEKQDPDPQQKGLDPQHWFQSPKVSLRTCKVAFWKCYLFAKLKPLNFEA